MAVLSPDFSQFTDRLIADNDARAWLRGAGDETQFIVRALSLAQRWTLQVTAEDLKTAGRDAARRWRERML